MSCLAPLGGVYQAGTLSGNPVAVSAGLKTLQLIQAPGFHQALEKTTTAFTEGLTAAAREAGVTFSAQNVGGMFGLYFSASCPDSYDSVMATDKAAFNQFFHAMLDLGIYLAPSAFEAGFVSAAHQPHDIDVTIAAAKKAFASLHK